MGSRILLIDQLPVTTDPLSFGITLVHSGRSQRQEYAVSVLIMHEECCVNGSSQSLRVPVLLSVPRKRAEMPLTARAHTCEILPIEWEVSQHANMNLAVVLTVFPREPSRMA